MFVQAVLVFLIAMLGYGTYALGSSLIHRPIVMCALMGVVLGDPVAGIQLGAALELIWLGSMAVGASNPPDMVAGSIFGSAYVIQAGGDAGAAVALAIPIAIFVQMLWNTIMAVIVPLVAARADVYAEECNDRGIEAMHWAGTFIPFVILSALDTFGFVVGVGAVQGIMDAVPAFVIDGLNIAMGIIPAIGFALVARMIVSKKTICFLFLGFLLVAAGGMNLVSVTVDALILAAILGLNIQTTAVATEAVDDDNEF